MGAVTVCLLFVYGAVFSWLSIPRVAQIVRKYKIYRKPSERDLHWRLVPKLTGIVFYAAFLVVSFAFVSYTDPRRLILLLCAGAIVVYVGIRDDIFELSPWAKLLLQLVAISLFVFGENLVVWNLNGFLGFYELPAYAAYFLTYFIGVFMINAFNLCDGIDGFAGMMGVVISFCYAVIFYITEDLLFMAYCVVLMGLLTGFLRFNLSFKKKVFMGDTGSLFLGFMFYLFTMYFVTDQSVILEGFLPSKSLVYIASMCLFMIPIIDSGSVFFFRALRKKSPFAADNNHLHHLALRYAKSHIKASLLLVGGLVFMIFVFARLSFTIPPNTTIALFFCCLIFWFVVVAILRRVPKDL